MQIISLFIMTMFAFMPMASACEPECRHAIAQEFAKRYKPLVEFVVDNLHEMLTANLNTVSAPEHLLAAVPDGNLQEGIRSAVDDVLEDFVNHFTGQSLEDDIYQVMFNKEDPFKGDCNNPKRLERKRPGVNEYWTMEECEAMDYICGNPPSICHFLGLIKQRIVNLLSTQLQENALASHGLLSQTLKQNTKQMVRFVITQYGAGSLRDDPEVTSYIDELFTMVQRALSSWTATNINRLCEVPEQDDLCNGWDNEIKFEILKWP